ncbi:acyl-CoA dehydrogenase type 2 domain [Bacillus freudenreichii]|nr:acyl-CoA dehydrogenase type 2 domain [Bacillus freudenreichii]
MIDFELTKEQKELQKLCSELSEEFAEVAEIHDKDRIAPVQNYRRLQEEGLTGFTVPKEYGGLGYSFVDYVIATEQLAQGCAATAMSFNMHVAGVAAIMENPDIDESFKKEVANLVINEKKIICQSVSEPSSSSLIGQSYTPSLKAKKVAGGYILRGKKAFASMFESSDYVYLYAHPEGSANPQESIGFFLPTDTEGIEVHDVWHTIGMRATRSNVAEYHDVFVPEQSAVHHTEKFLEDFIMRNARWAFGTFAAIYYGIGRGVLNWSKEMLLNRTPKGYTQSIAYHPSIRRRTGEMFADMESAKWMVYNMAWISDTKGPGVETFAACLRAKYTVGQTVGRTVRNASIACGAHGLMKDLPFERMLRDSLTAPIMPPNEDACLDQIGLIDMGLDPNESMPFLKEESLENVTELAR